jgi:hypothetical protein
MLLASCHLAPPREVKEDEAGESSMFGVGN